MKDFLFEHKDQLRYKFCGVRLSSLKALKEENKEVVELFGLESTHYFIYHTEA
jgi:hypothetical protein